MNDLTNAPVQSLKEEVIKTKVEIDWVFSRCNTWLGYENRVFFLEVEHMRN